MWKEKARVDPSNKLKETTKPRLWTPRSPVSTVEAKVTRSLIVGLKEVAKKVKVHIKEKERKPTPKTAVAAAANDKDNKLFAFACTSDFANVAEALQIPKSWLGMCIDSGASRVYSPVNHQDLRGTVRESTVHDSPPQNAVAEHGMRTRAKWAQALLIASGLSRFLWEEAMNHSTWLQTNYLQPC